MNNEIKRKKMIGKMGEDLSCNLLVDRGLKIIERNFRTRQGEIDIIADDCGELIFIEVKTRLTDNAGEPVESIDEKKQMQIKRMAEIYISQKNIPERPVRFDVITIQKTKENKTNLKWIKRAF